MFQKGNNLDLEIVLALLGGDNHLRALSKLTGSPPATVKRAADRLVAGSVIDAKRSGRNRVFSLRRTIEAKEYALAAEHYKALKCLGRYPYLAPAIEKLLASSKGMVIVFGSHANFTAKPASDIDVYCEKPPRSADKRVSVKSGDFDMRSPLIREIVLNHAVFRGAEGFYERTGIFEEGG